MPPSVGVPRLLLTKLYSFNSIVSKFQISHYRMYRMDPRIGWELVAGPLRYYYYYYYYSTTATTKITTTITATAATTIITTTTVTLLLLLNYYY
jgi:hypothetical protein